MGAVTCLMACRPESQASQPVDPKRVEALEEQIRRLDQTVGTMKIVLDALTKPAQPLPADQEFSIECPAPWEELGPMNQTQWACRTAEALPSGFWPNCNVSLGPAQAGTNPKAYFDSAMQTSPQLRSAKRISEAPRAIHGQRAYEAVYEHNITEAPLRVLATVVIRGESAYALTCTAPPGAFAGFEPAFRQMIGSFRLRIRS
jgi:hypothetical protein